MMTIRSIGMAVAIAALATGCRPAGDAPRTFGVDEETINGVRYRLVGMSNRDGETFTADGKRRFSTNGWLYEAIVEAPVKAAPSPPFEAIPAARIGSQASEPSLVVHGDVYKSGTNWVVVLDPAKGEGVRVRWLTNGVLTAENTGSRPFNGDARAAGMPTTSASRLDYANAAHSPPLLGVVRVDRTTNITHNAGTVPAIMWGTNFEIETNIETLLIVRIGTNDYAIRAEVAP